MEGETEEHETKSSVCRVCLNCNSKGLSLFEKYNNVYVFEKIHYIANIEIKEGDELPDRICSSCLLALESACNFKQKCERSDAILHSTPQLGDSLQEQSIEVPVKEEVEYESEYDYFEENVYPAELLKNDEVKPECNDAKSTVLNPVKSKAVNLRLECHDCGDFFKSKCKLQVHWKKVHQPRHLTCPNCKKILKSYKAFHSHMKKRSKSCRYASKLRVEGEGKSRIFYCKECDAHSPRIQTIMTHLVVHTGERPYVCNICNKTFTQHSSLASHREGAHKTYSKEGTCHQCGQHFKGRNRLYRHMKSHIKSEFPCKVCTVVLSTKAGWKIHMTRHSGVKSFTCELCAKTFYTSGDLCNHKTKTHKKNKVYSCDLCGYKTLNHSTMAKHRPKHKDDNVACDVCGMFMENLQQLTLHKKRHFEKNFQCIYCNKMYYRRKNLLAHARKQHKIYAIGCGKSNAVNELKVELQRRGETERETVSEDTDTLICGL